LAVKLLFTLLVLVGLYNLIDLYLSEILAMTLGAAGLGSSLVLVNQDFVILTGTERFKYAELLNFIREMLDDDVAIEMLGNEYRGHYVLTPYSFSPRVGLKLVNNPSIDFGQGLLDCINHLYEELQEEGLIDTAPVPKAYSE